MIKQTAKKVLAKLGINNPREYYEEHKLKLLGKPYYWTDYPMAVQIDTTNRCGPRYSGILCSYCFPQREVLCKRDCHADMPMEWIEWILKDISRNMTNLLDGSFPPKQQVCLFLNGDWQNEKRSEEILDLYTRLLPWLPNQVFTCATKPDQAWRFCNPKLKWVCVTLSASNPEIYKTVYKADRFTQVLESMKYIDQHAHSSQHLEVHFVITKDNIHGMQEWHNLIHDNFPRWRKIFSPLVKSETNQASVESMGTLTLEQMENAIRNVNKYQAFWDHRHTPLRQPCVLWNNAAIELKTNRQTGKLEGRLLTCCNWYDSDKFNFGTIEEYINENRTLKEYWHERLANLQRNPNCRACNLRHPEYMQRLKNIQFKTWLKQ